MLYKALFLRQYPKKVTPLTEWPNERQTENVSNMFNTDIFLLNKEISITSILNDIRQQKKACEWVTDGQTCSLLSKYQTMIVKSLYIYNDLQLI